MSDVGNINCDIWVPHLLRIPTSSGLTMDPDSDFSLVESRPPRGTAGSPIEPSLNAARPRTIHEQFMTAGLPAVK